MSLLGGYPLSSNPISGLPPATAATLYQILNVQRDNPQFPRAQQPAAFTNLLPSLLPTGLQPFASSGGPYPQFPRATQVYAFQSLLGTLLGSTPAPFIQTNWPNPQLRATVQVQSFNNYLPAGGQPLGQWLFTNPQTVQRVIQTDTFENLLNTLLAPQANPFFSWAWANPQMRAVTDPSLTSVPTNLLSTLLNPVQTMPFAQRDWPNPILPFRGEHLQPIPTNNLPNFPTPTPTPPDTSGVPSAGHGEPERDLYSRMRELAELQAEANNRRQERSEEAQEARERATRLETALRAERARSKRAASLRAEIANAELEAQAAMREASMAEREMTELLQAVMLLEREIEAQAAMRQLRFNAALALLLLEG